MDTEQLGLQCLVAAVIGASSGAIGAFILLRRMALVGDALSHVALPGIALALAYGVDPFWGVLVTLLAAALGVFWLESQSLLPVDTLVGLLFTSSLAIGILTIPDTEILESLFGAFPPLSIPAFVATVGAAALCLWLCFRLARPFLFLTVSPDLARIGKVGRGYELLLLLLFALIVALGIKLVGTLLMGALTIIPAAIARNLTAGMRRYMVASSVFGAGIAVGGMLAASLWGIRPGPIIILHGIAWFAVSLGVYRFKRRTP